MQYTQLTESNVREMLQAIPARSVDAEFGSPEFFADGDSFAVGDFNAAIINGPSRRVGDDRDRLRGASEDGRATKGLDRRRDGKDRV